MVLTGAGDKEVQTSNDTINQSQGLEYNIETIVSNTKISLQVGRQ